MQKITPFLWFDDKAEEAVSFYTSIFKNSKIVKIARYGDAGAQVSGSGITLTNALTRDHRSGAQIGSELPTPAAPNRYYAQAH